MSNYLVRRIRFQNGERHSVLCCPNGLPVHEATVYLQKYRRKGRAANTIHSVCCSLALFYKSLHSAKINLLERLLEGKFLTISELERFASIAQYHANDSQAELKDAYRNNVIHLSRIGFRKKREVKVCKPVNIATQATRLRHVADYLLFIADYVGATLPSSNRREFREEKTIALVAFREHIPVVSQRAKLNARMGLSEEEQNRILCVIHPDSQENPWARSYVRLRNWLIVALLLATGMRRGELLGLQISDLHPSQPKLQIIRRADATEDPRLIQPNAKTSDREIELLPSIMKTLWSYINNERRRIKAARKFPQIFVSDDGNPLSQASIDKLFAQIRQACPGLPMTLTSHVARHTWNERFSEEAEKMELDETSEQRARNSQQGWSDDSKMAVTYTRRYTAKKGRELSLKIQEKLDGQLK